MRKKLYNHLTNLLLPCLGFSVLTGICSAILITAFKILAEWTVHTSVSVYGTVRENPLWLPVLVLGAAAIGLAASLLLSASHSCKGGGIPTGELIAATQPNSICYAVCYATRLMNAF